MDVNRSRVRQPDSVPVLVTSSQTRRPRPAFRQTRSAGHDLKMRTRLPSWSATSRAGRLLLAVAAVLAVLATGAFTVALRTPPTRLTHTVRAEAPSTTALDAAGCPTTVRCLVRAELPGHISDAIQRGFPRSVTL